MHHCWNTLFCKINSSFLGRQNTEKQIVNMLCWAFTVLICLCVFQLNVWTLYCIFQWQRRQKIDIIPQFHSCIEHDFCHKSNAEKLCNIASEKGWSYPANTSRAPQQPRALSTADRQRHHAWSNHLIAAACQTQPSQWAPQRLTVIQKRWPFNFGASKESSGPSDTWYCAVSHSDKLGARIPCPRHRIRCCNTVSCQFGSTVDYQPEGLSMWQTPHRNSCSEICANATEEDAISRFREWRNVAIETATALCPAVYLLLRNQGYRIKSLRRTLSALKGSYNKSLLCPREGTVGHNPVEGLKEGTVQFQKEKTLT